MTTANRIITEKYPFICTTCAGLSEIYTPVTERGVPERRVETCPRCSKSAYILTMGGNGDLTVALVREVVRLRNDIFDLECEAEEREGQGHDR